MGATSGGIGGFTTYKYRVEMKDGAMIVKVKAQDTINTTKQKAVMVLNTAKATVDTQVHKLHASVADIASRAKINSIAAVGLAQTKASEAFNFATTTKVGTTSSSAVAGAVVGGTTTGAFGTVAGAAVGVVPAIFTFGLSIPAGAVIGLCVGAAVGGSAGAVGGGALGYGGFTHREAIRSSWKQVNTRAERLKTRACTRASDAKDSVKTMVRGSTGGSDLDKVDLIGKEAEAAHASAPRCDAKAVGGFEGVEEEAYAPECDAKAPSDTNISFASDSSKPFAGKARRGNRSAKLSEAPVLSAVQPPDYHGVYGFD